VPLRRVRPAQLGRRWYLPSAQFRCHNAILVIALHLGGSPTVSNVEVMVALPNGTTTTTPSVPVYFDSGDSFGSIPAFLLGTGQMSDAVPVETIISVYTSSGQLLYSYMTRSANALKVTGTVMNTGNVPFEQGPVYISESPAVSGRQPSVPDLQAPES
jgi:hypothetical protein